MAAPQFQAHANFGTWSIDLQQNNPLILWVCDVNSQRYIVVKMMVSNEVFLVYK